MSKRMRQFVFITILGFVDLGFCESFSEHEEIKCVSTGPGSEHGMVKEIALISRANYTSLIDGKPPDSTKGMPSRPEEPSIHLHLHENVAGISWFPPTDGLTNLKHYLLKVVEVADYSVHHTYVLVRVRGPFKPDSKLTCFYNLRSRTEQLTSTIWAFGHIRNTVEGHMTADVDEESKSETVTKKTSKAYLTNLEETCKCISSDLRLNIKPFPSCIKFNIKSNSFPTSSKLKIELVKSADDFGGKGDVLRDYIKISMNRHYHGEFKVKKTGKYFIRVHRLCNKDYLDTCSNMIKKQPEVIRSNSIHILSPDSQGYLQPISKLKNSSLTSNAPQPLASSKEVVATQLGMENEDVNRVVHLVVMIAGFGVTAIIEIAIIARVCSVYLFGRRPSSSSSSSSLSSKLTSIVTVDRYGQTSTSILKTKQVAIIFTKDSSMHMSRIFQLKSVLRRRGCDVTLYDETIVPGMRLNWIQVGEKIATDSDVVLFVVSPHLIKLCRRHDFLGGNEDGVDKAVPSGGATYVQKSAKDGQKVKVDGEEVEGKINVLTSGLHKLPVVVMNSLKVGNIMPDSAKPKVISVYFEENNTSVKDLVHQMRREHPSLMYEDHILNFDKVDNEINDKQIKHLADKIKS